MKFKEFFNKIIESSNDRLETRKKNIQRPEFIESTNKTAELMQENFRNGCIHTVEAFNKFIISGPIGMLLEGGKEFGRIISHNAATKNENDKLKYSSVPAEMIIKLAREYCGGLISSGLMLSEFSKALGRATILGSRYLIGK